MATTRRFNYLNFFYGIGAVVILIAAVFKFLVWEHANTIFTIGIIIEALVFLISAFEWSSGPEESYAWEKVFPQLSNKDSEDTDLDLNLSPEALEGTKSQQMEKIMQSIVSINGSVNQLNEATKKLTRSVEVMEGNYEKMSSSTSKYQQEIDTLSAKIADANKKLNTFDNFNFKK